VSDEWHQSFVPQRHSSAADVVKDFGGAALAALVYWRLAARRFPERSLAS
jgi:VanZ family protein